MGQFRRKLRRELRNDRIALVTGQVCTILFPAVLAIWTLQIWSELPLYVWWILTMLLVLPGVVFPILFRLAFKPIAKAHIRMVLLDRGLLALALIPDFFERIPSLKPRLGCFGIPFSSHSSSNTLLTRLYHLKDHFGTACQHEGLERYHPTIKRWVKAGAALLVISVLLAIAFLANLRFVAEQLPWLAIPAAEAPPLTILTTLCIVVTGGVVINTNSDLERLAISEVLLEELGNNAETGQLAGTNA